MLYSKFSKSTCSASCVIVENNVFNVIWFSGTGSSTLRDFRNLSLRRYNVTISYVRSSKVCYRFLFLISPRSQIIVFFMVYYKKTQSKESPGSFIFPMNSIKFLSTFPRVNDYTGQRVKWYRWVLALKNKACEIYPVLIALAWNCGGGSRKENVCNCAHLYSHANLTLQWQ